MKPPKLLLLLPITLAAGPVRAQALKPLPLPKVAATSKAPETPIYTYVDHMPELPAGGGMPGVLHYFFQHFHLTKQQSDNATGGSVYLTFVVSETGAVTQTRIVRSGGSIIDTEALRVVRGMPRFRPGRLHGVPVRVRLTLPISCIKPQ